MGFIVLYIVCWIGVGLLARHKRRGVGRWMFFGLLFLLPVTIILVCLPKARMRHCRYCAEQIKEEAQVCRWCGRPQTAGAIAGAPAWQTPMPRP